MKMKRLPLALGMLLYAVACGSEPEPLPGPGGTGGMADGGEGGAGGSGGSGGGSGGAGGISTGGSGGDPGTGGIGGQGGVGGMGGKLGLPGEWSRIELAESPTGFALYEGEPSTLDFPVPVWEACGPGCEATRLEFGDNPSPPIVGTRATAEGSVEAVVSLSYSFPERNGFIRRVVRLRDGQTLGAFAVRQEKSGRKPQIAALQNTALSNYVLLRVDDESLLKLYVSMEPSGRWLFREPWDPVSYRPLICQHFDIHASAPAYLFACGLGLEVMQETSEVTILPDSEGAVFGTSSHGRAVWAQHVYSKEPTEPHRTRVRAWEPGQDARELAEIEGLICGLGAGADRVVGLIGEEIDMGTGCFGGLTEARFFHMSRDGGPLAESRRLVGKSWNVGSASVNRDYMAVLLSAHPFVPHRHRWKVVLVRLSDWTMRAFPEPAQRSISTSAVAVDDEYVYFATKYDLSENQKFEYLYRYRLDHFDQIGEAFDPATAVPEEYR